MRLRLSGFVCLSQAGIGLPDQTLLDRMDGAIRHRGPDAHGAHQAGRAAMRHRRLAIIDLSGGRQPMSSADGKVAWLTLGESFTFLKLVGAAITMAGVAWAQFGGAPRRVEAEL